MPQGTVSWFNADKGFGFVAPDEDGPDVFLHVSAVAGDPPLEGDRVEYDVRQGDRGPQAEHARVLLDGAPLTAVDDVVVLQGTASWFSPDKGFGFVVPDDVFVHGSAVVGGGLEPGSRVVFELRMGDRGPQAEQVRPVVVPPRDRDRERGRDRDGGRDTGGRSAPVHSGGGGGGGGAGNGAVAWFDAGKGFGFLTPDDGSADLFVHISSVAGAQVLEEGQRVAYAVQEGPRGPVAVDVRPVE